MGQQPRVMARDLITPSMLILVYIMALLCVKGEIIVGTVNIGLIVLAGFIIVPYSIYCITHTVFLTSDGIEVLRFGVSYKKLAWYQISEVAILRDFSISFRTSGTCRIVFVSERTPPYNPQTWFGMQYLFRFRKDVIWVDASKQNISFLEQLGISITDYRYI